MTGKAIAYFFFGFVAGLIIVEYGRENPFAPVQFHDGKALETRIYYYRYNPYQYNEIYPYGYYNYNVNTYSRGNNSGRQRSSGENKGGSGGGEGGSGTTHTGTKSFNHTAQERTDSWGKKN